MTKLIPQNFSVVNYPPAPELLTAGAGFIPPTDKKTALLNGDFPAHGMYGDDQAELRDKTNDEFERIVLDSLGDTASRGANIAAGLPHATNERVAGDEEWDPVK